MNPATYPSVDSSRIAGKCRLPLANMHRPPPISPAHDPLARHLAKASPTMIDLHLHVLPGVDDGSSSWEMSIAMLDQLAGMGAREIVATPHLMDPLTATYGDLVSSAHEALVPLAAERGISVRLGFEHLLAPGLAKRLEGGEPSAMDGGSAVLVELPFMSWPQHTESSLFGLRVANYVPILAHPERYLDVQNRPDLAISAGAAGAVLQVTSASLAGVYGKTVERTARQLLGLAIDRDVPVVLASDAHSNGLRLARVPSGLSWIRAHLPHGQQIVHWATEIVPFALLNGKDVPTFRRWFELEFPNDEPLPMSPKDAVQSSPWKRLVGWITS